MSPKKSQKKFSAIPMAATKPAMKTIREAIVPTEAAPAPSTPAIAEVNPAEVKPTEVATAAEVTAITEVTEVAPSETSPIAVAAAEVVATPSRAAELIAALNNVDADIARDAAAELGLLKDMSALEPLIGALANTDGFTHPVVRAAAATSLGQLGSAAAVEALIAAIGDSMAEASAEAVRALALLADARAIPALIEVVRNSNRFYLPTVRRAAVAALGQLGGPIALSELRLVAADSWEDAVIRDAATEAALSVSAIEGTEA